MNRIWQTSIAVLFLQLLLIFPNPVPAQVTNPEDEVSAAVSAFGRAFAEADVNYLRSRLTQAYIHVNGSSGNVLQREEWLNWIQSRQAALASGDLVISDYSIDGLEVEIYGQTAVVTGVAETRGIQKGVQFNSRIRFTNTWLKQGGTWLRAAFHDSAVD